MEHKDVLIAYAEGKRIQFNTNTGGNPGWVEMQVGSHLNPISRPWWLWRIADEYIPKIKYGDRFINPPVFAELESGQEVYFVSPNGVFLGEWQDSVSDNQMMADGFVHLVREHANEHYEAIVKLNTQTPE